MTPEDDVSCRRLAIQLAAQLPATPAEARRAVEHLLELVPWISGTVDIPEPRATVTQLRTVE